MSGRLNNTVLKTLSAKKTVRARVPLARPASGALTSTMGLQRAAKLSRLFFGCRQIFEANSAYEVWRNANYPGCWFRLQSV